MRLRTIPAIAAALVAALLAAPAAAQVAPDLGELSLDQLLTLRVDTVFGASRYEQKLTRAPASVTIVTREEIRRYGYRTLADVLRSVRGIYVGDDRNYSQIGVRGFARPGDFNTRVLLLMDGHRLNENIYSSALIGREGFLDVDLIERVEVIRGPSSSIYGSSAFFGVINVVTRQGGAVSGVEASASAGSFGSYEGRATFGRKLASGVELLASGTAYESDGQRRLYYPEFDTPRTNNGVAVDSDGESSRSFLGRVGYKGFTLTGGYSVREKTVPTAAYGAVFNDGNLVTTNEKALAELSYFRALSARTRFTARAYFDHDAYQADVSRGLTRPPAPPMALAVHVDNRGDTAGAEAQVTTELSGGHTLVYGGEYRQDLLIRQKTTTGQPFPSLNQTENEGRSIGLYTQGEVALLPRLLLNAGARYDHHDVFGSTLSPRIGLIWGPAPGTALKALYGRAYRAPNAYELYLDAPGSRRANPSLQPETVDTYELVAEQELPAGLRVAASAYVYDVDDLISHTRDGAGILMFENVDSVRARGFELELDGAWAWGFLFRASWAIQRTEDGRTRAELDNSPRHLFKLNASLPVYRDLVHAGLEAQLGSGVETRAGNQTSPSFLVNTTLRGKTPLRNLEWSVSLYNLLDDAYAQPGSTNHVQDEIPQDGRSFRVKAAYRF